MRTILRVSSFSPSCFMRKLVNLAWKRQWGGNVLRAPQSVMRLRFHTRFHLQPLSLRRLPEPSRLIPFVSLIPLSPKYGELGASCTRQPLPRPKTQLELKVRCVSREDGRRGSITSVFSSPPLLPGRSCSADADVWRPHSKTRLIGPEAW